MKPIDINKFKELHSKFVNHKTFTNEKRNDQKILLDYLKSHDFVEISVNKKYMPINKIWEYDVYVVPNDKNGKHKIWRGQTIIRFCISYSIYLGNTLICCPIK